MRAWWKARSKPGTLPEGGVYATAGTSSWPPQGLFDEPLHPPEPPGEEPPVGASWARPVVTVEPPAIPLPPPPARSTRADARRDRRDARRDGRDAPETRLEMPSEFLRLLEVVTSMCDHVIEYIEADRVERRLMVETLTQLGHVITEGAPQPRLVRSPPHRSFAPRCADGRILRGTRTSHRRFHARGPRDGPRPTRSGTRSGTGTVEPQRERDGDRGRSSRALRRSLGRRLRDLRGHDDTGRPALPAPAQPRRRRASRAVRRHQHPARRDV